MKTGERERERGCSRKKGERGCSRKKGEPLNKVVNHRELSHSSVVILLASHGVNQASLYSGWRNDVGQWLYKAFELSGWAC